MEKFAGYGFNKSHAAAYALVAYQTAYFKAHHPAAFMAANLSLVMDDTDKVKSFYDDALAQGLAILPPDVNASSYRFEPVDASSIRYGLGGVKGTGEAAIEAIVAARDAGGPFADLFDFCRRVDKRVVNRRVVEALVRAGAFDAIDPRRAALLASVGLALDAGERAEATAAQVSLFGEERRRRTIGALVATREWTEAERLMQEKSALGFYLSGHPFTAYAAELAPVVRTSLADLRRGTSACWSPASSRRCACRASRRGKMAFVTLDDGKGRAEIMVYNETFDAVRALLREDQLVIAEVKVTQRMTDDGEAQGLRIIAENVYDLATIRKRWAQGPSRSRATATRRPTASRRSCAVPSRRRADHRRYRNERIGGEVELPDVARQPRRRADRAAARLARAGERAGRVLTAGTP